MPKPLPVDLDAYLAQPPPCARNLGKLFAPGRPLVVFDIGACEGEDSIRYARMFPRSRVFTFEPLPANQAIIRANFIRYGLDRAELVPLALSNRAGPADFHVSAGRPAGAADEATWNYGNKSSSLLPPTSSTPMHGWIQFPEKITVACETLDAFCAQRSIERIDFIHLDVQGAEGAVLAGAEQMLSHVGAIWMEVSNQELYRGQKLRTDIERLMRSRGFWLAHHEQREIEGDQFYVNLRSPAALLWRAGTLLRPLRRRLGLIPSG